MEWKLWLRGLVAAVIQGVATGVAAWTIDAKDFNVHDGIVKLGQIALVSGVIGAALYIKKHPPINEVQ